MTRTCLPSEDCVFRLDSAFGFRQQFPMTFNDVGLSSDGFEFDGISSYTKMDNDVSIQARDGITIEAIINPTGDLIREDIVNKYLNNEYWFKITNGKLNSYFGGTSIPDIKSNASIDPDAVTHVAVTYSTSGGSNNHNLYINGELDKTSTVTGSIANGAADIYVGKNPVGAQFFHGSIAFLSIYRRAYTAQEVSDRYRQTTFLFRNETPTPTQQKHIDWQDSRKIGRQ